MLREEAQVGTGDADGGAQTLAWHKGVAHQLALGRFAIRPFGGEFHRPLPPEKLPKCLPSRNLLPDPARKKIWRWTCKSTCIQACIDQQRQESGNALRPNHAHIGRAINGVRARVVRLSRGALRAWGDTLACLDGDLVVDVITHPAAICIVPRARANVCTYDGANADADAVTYRTSRHTQCECHARNTSAIRVAMNRTAIRVPTWIWRFGTRVLKLKRIESQQAPSHKPTEKSARKRNGGCGGGCGAVGQN